MYRGDLGPLEGLVIGEMVHIRATIWAAIERLNEPPIEQLIERSHIHRLISLAPIKVGFEFEL